MTVQSNKTLGALGACLTIAGVIGTAASVLNLAIGSSTTGILEIGIVGVGGLLGS
jgi:hypothetical protein